MAKKETAPKNVLERTYNVPLRKEFLKAPNWNRTPKAVRALKQFIVKHMKSEDVSIGRYANELLWKKGIKSPPHHIKVNVTKDNKGKVVAELVELPGKAKRAIENLKQREKKKEDTEKQKEAETKVEPAKESKKTTDVKDALAGKEVKDAEVVEEKKEGKAKEVQKEGIKELKEDAKKHHAAPKQESIPKNVQKQQTAPKSQ
ncbi:60S ribosomal protein L31 [Candidatus Woesearchaeota archaeon]|nr:60S ribosomal protein L31 [Candidatus Woesearchaeota archaeon]